MNLRGHILSMLATWTEANLTKKYHFPTRAQQTWQVRKQKSFYTIHSVSSLVVTKRRKLATAIYRKQFPVDSFLFSFILSPYAFVLLSHGPEDFFKDGFISFAEAENGSYEKDLVVSSSSSAQ